MSEAIWIELIKVLPAFLWIGFGFIALAVAKRVFSAQAPRMTKVETPWVTVELAQQAIEQASVRGTAADAPPFEPNWYPPLPAQQNGAGFDQPVPPGNGSVPPPPIFNGPVPPGGAPGGTVPPPRATPTGGSPSTAGPQSPSGGPPPPLYDAMEDREDDPFETEQRTDSDAKVPNTPPADEPSDNTPGSGGTDTAEAPPSPVTEPNRQVPNVPPTYPLRPAPPGNPDGGYYARPAHTAYPPPPLPPYQAVPAYQPAPADSRSRRTATRLALSERFLRGGSILWVDDHPEKNESLAQLFSAIGIRVDTVLSTEAAMQALKLGDYNLVISDVGRPNEPNGSRAGLELLDRMTRAGLPTPVVFYTSHTAAGSVSHPRLAAATAYPEDVVDYVIDFVGHRSDGPNAKETGWLDRIRS